MSKKKKTGTRNPVGWGYIEDGLTTDEKAFIDKAIPELFDTSRLIARPRPRPEDIELLPSRLTVPAKLSEIVSVDHHERLLRAAGRSFNDLAGLRERSPHPAPDAAAMPTNQEDLERVLEWARGDGLAVIPFGGGSSVVGGVNMAGTENYKGVVTVDLQKMNRVLEVSERERVVHAEAGILGPALDDALRPSGLFARHVPQSYHHSTLGGWVATRGAGHNSTVHTKIEDRVQSLEGMLADGTTFATRPLPATSIGPDPRAPWTGSEGMLGFITSVRLRVYQIPRYRAFRGFNFADFETALEAARTIAQADLFPVQLRILDPDENAQTARLAGQASNGRALMIIAEESHLPVVDGKLAVLSELVRDAGGVLDDEASKMLRTWIRLFFRQPHIRDHLLDRGVIAETLETSIPWSRVPDFYREVRKAARDAVSKAGGTGHVGCRVTHVYPDGPCLYYTIYGPGRSGSLESQWTDIKNAVSQAICDGGGTISHHHAMGRDHRPWARRELPEVHRRAIREMKRALDPDGLMNPGLWFED